MFEDDVDDEDQSVNEKSNSTSKDKFYKSRSLIEKFHTDIQNIIFNKNGSVKKIFFSENSPYKVIENEVAETSRVSQIYQEKFKIQDMHIYFNETLGKLYSIYSSRSKII